MNANDLKVAVNDFSAALSHEIYGADIELGQAVIHLQSTREKFQKELYEVELAERVLKEAKAYKEWVRALAAHDQDRVLDAELSSAFKRVDRREVSFSEFDMLHALVDNKMYWLLSIDRIEVQKFVRANAIDTKIRKIDDYGDVYDLDAIALPDGLYEACPATITVVPSINISEKECKPIFTGSGPRKYFFSSDNDAQHVFEATMHEAFLLNAIHIADKERDLPGWIPF